MTIIKLAELLGPDWAKLTRQEARVACRSIDPRYRRDAYRLWWDLVVNAPKPTKAPKPKKEG